MFKFPKGPCAICEKWLNINRFLLFNGLHTYSTQSAVADMKGLENRTYNIDIGSKNGTEALLKNKIIGRTINISSLLFL